MNTRHVLTAALLATTLSAAMSGAGAQRSQHSRTNAIRTTSGNYLANRGSNKSQPTKVTLNARKSGGDNGGTLVSFGKNHLDAAPAAAKAQPAKPHVSEITVTKTTDAASPN